MYWETLAVDMSCSSVIPLIEGPAGLRRSELAGLKWEDVDFKHLHLNVSRSLVDQHVGPVILRPHGGFQIKSVTIFLTCILGEPYA